MRMEKKRGTRGRREREPGGVESTEKAWSQGTGVVSAMDLNIESPPSDKPDARSFSNSVDCHPQ